MYVLISLHQSQYKPTAANKHVGSNVGINRATTLNLLRHSNSIHIQSRLTATLHNLLICYTYTLATVRICNSIKYTPDQSYKIHLKHKKIKQQWQWLTERQMTHCIGPSTKTQWYIFTLCKHSLYEMENVI